MDEHAQQHQATPDAPPPSGAAVPERPAGPDPETLARGLAELRRRQRLVRGLVAGLVAGAVCVVAWGAFTGYTHTQVGYIALGVGFLVGLAVRTQGRAITPQFRILAALLAVLATFGGNMLAVLIMGAAHLKISVGEMLRLVLENGIGGFSRAVFEPMDLVFYALAGWIAFRTGAGAPTLEEVLAAAALPDAQRAPLDDAPMAAGDDGARGLPDR